MSKIGESIIYHTSNSNHWTFDETIRVIYYRTKNIQKERYSSKINLNTSSNLQPLPVPLQMITFHDNTTTISILSVYNIQLIH